MKPLACALMALACAAAQAQTIYRCGADGRSYSQSPCEHGRKLDLSDARTPAQQQEAEAVADHARTLADALERDRLERAAATPPAAAGAIGGRPKVAPSNVHPDKARGAKKKRRKASRGAGAEDFRAVAPARPRS
ncbi:MAG: hypothetical protein KF891_19980 [Rhizobacter sp.]|nr:hypothetical protein [Rhizobacter sp.]